MILWFYHFKDAVQLIRGVKAKCIAYVLLSMTSRDLECFRDGNTVKKHRLWWFGVFFVVWCFFFLSFLIMSPLVVVMHRTATAEQRALPRIRFVLHGKLPDANLPSRIGFYRRWRPRGRSRPARRGEAAPAPPAAGSGGAAAVPGAAGGSSAGGQQDRAFSCSTGSSLPRAGERLLSAPQYSENRSQAPSLSSSGRT